MICQVCKATPSKPANVTPKTWAKRKYCSIECRTKAWQGEGSPKWHTESNRRSDQTHNCQCGCGVMLQKYDYRGRVRNYLTGHQMASKKRVFTDEWIENMKKANRENRKTGEQHWNWKGGITKPNHLIRNSTEYKEWRMACLRRDYFTCINCNNKPKNVVVDHIKPFSLYPELRFDVKNGRTLCRPCDKKLGFNYSRYLKEQKVSV